MTHGAVSRVSHGQGRSIRGHDLHQFAVGDPLVRGNIRVLRSVGRCTEEPRGRPYIHKRRHGRYATCLVSKQCLVAWPVATTSRRSILAFRPWLDVARLLFLLLVHIGTALLFTIWVPIFSCPSEPSQYKVCHNVNIAIVVCSWVVPTFLVWYAAFLAVSWRLWHEDQKQMVEEAFEKRLSELPMMLPSNRHPALGPDNKLPSNVSNMPPVSRGSLPPPSQLPPRPLPIPPQPQPLSQPKQPVSQPPQTQMNPIVLPSHLSNSHTSYLQPTTQNTSTRWSQPPSIGSVYSASQSSRSSHSSRPSLTLQTSGRPPSQPLSARPPSHLPPPRPPSHLPSPSTPIPQRHSRSSSQARLLALAMQPPTPVDETGDRYSPRSSGRLSKPTPLQWAY